MPPQIPAVFLTTLLDALEVGYGKYRNPYHNQAHAADVTQTVHCFLLRTGMLVWGHCGVSVGTVWGQRGDSVGTLWGRGSPGLCRPRDACCHGDGTAWRLYCHHSNTVRMRGVGVTPSWGSRRGHLVLSPPLGCHVRSVESHCAMGTRALSHAAVGLHAHSGPLLLPAPSLGGAGLYLSLFGVCAPPSPPLTPCRPALSDGD